MSSPTIAERKERVEELIAGQPEGRFPRPPCDSMPWNIGKLDNLVDAHGNTILETCRWDAQTGAAESNAVNAEIVHHLSHIAKAGFPSDIVLLQDRVHAMSDRLFPNRDVKRAFLKLFEELGEVIRNPRDPKEWADVFILMLDLSRHYGVGIEQAVDDKCAELETRVWVETETGTYQHVPGARVVVAGERALMLENLVINGGIEGRIVHG